MTDAAHTAICMLIDHSGSMATIQAATEEAINGYIYQQAVAEGRRTIRITTFNSEVTPFCPSMPAGDVPTFFLEPYGTTALLDAMGDTITEFGAELAAMPEDQRPGHVVFAVMTDGKENSSREYTWPQVRAMVEHQRGVYGWEVLYLGANQDAIAVGAELGVRRDSSLTYAATDAGTRSAVSTMSDYTTTVSRGGRGEITDEQRVAAMEE